MLRFLADRGGETKFDFRNVQVAVRKAFMEMNRKAVITIGPSEGFGVVDVLRLATNPISVMIRLSDQGRAILDSMNAVTVGNG